MKISASTCRTAARRRARDDGRTSWLVVGAALLALTACDNQGPIQSEFELPESSFEDQLEGDDASVDVSPSPSTSTLATFQARGPQTQLAAPAQGVPSGAQVERVTAAAGTRTSATKRSQAAAASPAKQPETPASAPLDDAPEASQPLLASTNALVRAEPVMAPAPPPVPAPITSADFVGRYRFVGGQSQRAKVAAAIEATVDSLPLMFRGIARKRLTQANPIDTSLDIGVKGGEVRTSFASGFSVTCPLDGPAVRARSMDGQKLDVRMRSQGAKLVQQIKSRSSSGAGKVVFVLSEDRSRLTVHHEVSSPRLPVPVRYSLSYARN